MAAGSSATGVAALFADAPAFVRADPLWHAVAAATLAVAPPHPGQRVLDACCGAGATALPTALAVGPSGAVDGVDLAASLLGVARERAIAADASWLSYVQDDVTRFGEDAAYDRVQCVLGVFFLPDVDAAARHLLTRLRRSGVLVLTTWAQGALGAFVDVLRQAVGAEPSQPHAGVDSPGAAASRESRLPGRTAGDRLATPEGHRELLAAAGAREVRVERVPVEVPLDGDLAVALLDGSAARSAVAHLDDAARDRVRARLRAALERPAVLDASVLVSTGRR